MPSQNHSRSADNNEELSPYKDHLESSNEGYLSSSFTLEDETKLDDARTRRQTYAICFFTFTLGLLLGTFVARASFKFTSETFAGVLPQIYGSNEHNPPEKPSWVLADPCSRNAKTARARGCVFEVLTYSWLPPECHDHQADSQFLSDGNWSWFKHSANPPFPQLTLEEIREGTHHGVHVSWGYHVTHCTFIWQKMHRAVISGRPIDSHVADLEHTKHCSRRFIENGLGVMDEDSGQIIGPPPEWEALVTQLALKFPSCQDPIRFA